MVYWVPPKVRSVVRKKRKVTAFCRRVDYVYEMKLCLISVVTQVIFLGSPSTRGGWKVKWKHLNNNPWHAHGHECDVTVIADKNTHACHCFTKRKNVLYKFLKLQQKKLAGKRLPNTPSTRLIPNQIKKLGGFFCKLCFGKFVVFLVVLQSGGRISVEIKQLPQSL